MSRKRLRPVLAALVVLVVASSAVLIAAARGPSTSTARQSGIINAGEQPTALARYLATAPGVEMQEGPASAGDAEFNERAYPDTTISVAEMEGARDAWASGSDRHSSRGDERRGSWEPIGPSRALYPFEELRDAFLYVPNEHVAGGRTTAIALSPRCRRNHCTAYITPAGGGVWKTDDALDRDVRWEYLGGPLGINAAGAVTIDPNDRDDDTVYVGTGEANICGSGCVAGTGLYKSTNGGRTWKNLGKPEFQGKGIGQIVVKPGDPKTLYVGSTTALAGMSSVCCTGVTRPVPGIMKWGLYKSTNGGQSWSFIHNGSADSTQCTGTIAEFNGGTPCSPRGVRHVALDPSNSGIVYASSYGRGIWRSNDAGATWTQIKVPVLPPVNTFQARSAFTVNKLSNGKTRMYVHEGSNNTQGQTANPHSSRLYRSDDVATGAPAFTDMSSNDPAVPGFAFRGICDPQCWYDLFIYSPPGSPDIVYVGGDYFYGETIANKRGVMLSRDAGVSGTDMTFDGTDMLHPNGIHPDQHSLVTIPGKPLQFIETGDGGLIRSSGELVDRSSWCDDPNRGLTNPVRKERCKQMLSAIPSRLDSMNDGLSTLQFQSLSVSPHDIDMLQGGTQDNGTWENKGRVRTWVNTMIGDGGQSGFDVGIPEFRMHNFTGPSPDVNFDNGELSKWIWTGGPISPEGGEFYAPVSSDPVVSKTMFAGTSQTAYRTKTAGLGTRTYDQAQAVCNEWTGTGPFGSCGDWARLGPTPLTSAAWGDRAGGNMAAIERTTDDTSTAWAATTTGRVFVSKNVDADPAAAVTWRRIDLPTTPGRFVSSIYIDAEDGNHAWVSYSGFDVNTPSTPGHAFEVRFDPVAGTATWTDRSYNWGDLPMTDLVRDDVKGDLYAASDFGVAMLPRGGTNWVRSASGLPNVEVAGLTIVPQKRVLFAATHGLSAWKLDLRRGDSGHDDDDDDD